MTSDQICSIIGRSLGGEWTFPSREVLNEQWMLRLCLDWYEQNGGGIENPILPSGRRWYSMPILPSPFLPRHRGDPHSEGHLRVGAVMGDFRLEDATVGSIELNDNARSLTVVDARIHGAFSVGTQNAPGYDEAARTVGCIAELLRQGQVKPQAMEQIGLSLVAGSDPLESAGFAGALTLESIEGKVGKRVAEYGEDAAGWYAEWFMPLLEHLEIASVSWEEIVSQIESHDSRYGRSVQSFYDECVRTARVPGEFPSE